MDVKKENDYNYFLLLICYYMLLYRAIYELSIVIVFWEK